MVGVECDCLVREDCVWLWSLLPAYWKGTGVARVRRGRA